MAKAPRILGTDTLRLAYPKLNMAIDNSNEALTKASTAETDAADAKSLSESTQEQLNNLIIENGTSDSEVIQARTRDENGETQTFPLLKDRLDNTDNKLVENARNFKDGISQTEERSFYRSLLGHKKQKPSITWVDDDGVLVAIDRLLPIARANSIPMTFAVITSRFGNADFVNKDTVIQLQSEGFEFVDHGYAHDTNYRPTQMTADELREDLKHSKSIWNEMGIEQNIHVIPFGANTPTTQRIYREFFDAAIMTTTDGTSGADGRGVPNFLPVENYRLGRVAYPAPLEHIQAQIDNAVRNNGWVIIMSHMSADVFDELKITNIISHAKNKGLEFITLQEGLNRFGNIANFGELGNAGGNVIQADGSLSGDIGSFITSTFKRDPSPNAPITYFQKNSVTTDRISNPRAIDYGLPSGLGGVMHTYRADDDRYSYQLHIDWQRGEQRIRTWNVDTNSWNSFKPNTPIRNFTREVSGRNFASGESYQTTLSVANVSPNDVFIANPNGVMPIGIVWNVQYQGGDVLLRITNTNNSDRYLDTMDWIIKQIVSV